MLAFRDTRVWFYALLGAFIGGCIPIAFLSIPGNTALWHVVQPVVALPPRAVLNMSGLRYPDLTPLGLLLGMSLFCAIWSLIGACASVAIRTVWLLLARMMQR